MYRYREVAHLQPSVEQVKAVPAAAVPPPAAPSPRQPEVGPPVPARRQKRAPRHVPMAVRVFHRDTIYWVRARIVPKVMWVTLLEYVLDGIHSKSRSRLPRDPYSYTYYDMDDQALLGPLDPVADGVAAEILFIHKSEFVNAYDDMRRARLIADLLRTEHLKVKHQHVRL